LILEQRRERRKWIPAFSNISSIFFFVNITGFGRELFEDSSVNHLKESISLLDEFLRGRMFKGIPFFLILTKFDLFEECLDFSNFQSFEKECDTINMTSKEIISKLLNDQDKCRVTLFETCGFDKERNDYLFELAQKKINGELLDEYYPYDFIQKKPVLSFQLFDINFLFLENI
jgi:hypothetical protein